MWECIACAKVGSMYVCVYYLPANYDIMIYDSIV